MYLLCRWDYNNLYYLESMDHLMHFQQEGLIRNIGLCNFDTKNMLRMLKENAPIVSNQVSCSVIKCLIILLIISSNTGGLFNHRRSSSDDDGVCVQRTQCETVMLRHSIGKIVDISVFKICS